MKKLLYLLALVPLIVSGQIPAPLVDLSKYHDDNRLMEMTDKNFTDITTGVYTQPVIKTDSAVIDVLDYSPPHGAMSFADSASVIALTQNNWGKITNAANDLFTIQDEDDLEFDGDTITIEVAGDYIVNWSLSFSGGPSDVFQIAIYKNAALESVKMSRKTSNNDTGNMGLPAYIENLVIGDDLSFYIRNTGDNDDATMVSSSIVIYMLHPD